MNRNRKELIEKYIKFGWEKALIPLHGKIRFTKEGEEITKELLYDESNNIGLLTGSVSGVVVIDYDKFKELEYDKTLVSKTPNGFHVYYKLKDTQLIRNAQDIEGTRTKGFQIDIRGEGGYVVIPPSVGYEWVSKSKLKELPDRFILKEEKIDEVADTYIQPDRLKELEEVITKYPCYQKIWTEVRKEGEHHYSAIRIIALLKDEKAKDNEIYSMLTKWDEVNNSYLGSKEIRKLIQKQCGKQYLYDCKDEFLRNNCNATNCPLKQLDSRYLPLIRVNELEKQILELADKLPEARPEYPISLSQLNAKMWGLRRGELTVVAGFASYGKSAFINQLAIDCLNVNKKVLIFTTESSSNEVLYRILSSYYTIPSFHFRNCTFSDNERATLRKAVSKLNEWGLQICDKSKPLIEDVEFALQRVKPDIIFVDYLQRCVVGHDRYEQLNDWMQSLKTFAKIYQIPVVVASQINRASKAEGQPGLHHLLGSGSIEQEADVVLILDRTKVVDADELPMTCRLEKGRNCGCGVYPISFNKRYLTFTESKEPKMNEKGEMADVKL